MWTLILCWLLRFWNCCEFLPGWVFAGCWGFTARRLLYLVWYSCAPSRAVHHHHHRGDILSLRLEECVETSPPENDVLVCVCCVSLRLYTESICFLRLHIDAPYQLHITALLSLYLRGLICCDWYMYPTYIECGLHHALEMMFFWEWFLGASLILITRVWKLKFSFSLSFHCF